MGEVILGSGCDAGRVLQTGGGVVHCVFENTLYLEGRNLLCCLGHRNLVAGPLNISTSLHNFINLKTGRIRQGDVWQFEHQILTIAKSYQFDAANINWWQAEKPTLTVDSKQLELATATVRRIVEPLVVHKQVPASVTGRLVEKNLKSGMLALEHWLRCCFQHITTVPDDLLTLIGCGDGLTPAGDDVLCAVLVTLHALDVQPAATLLSDWTQTVAPALTSQLSFSHLHSACQGRAVEPLHHFINTLFDTATTTEQHDHVTLKLVNYGSSSGYYALQGIMLVLDVFVQQWNYDTESTRSS